MHVEFFKGELLRFIGDRFEIFRFTGTDDHLCVVFFTHLDIIADPLLRSSNGPLPLNLWVRNILVCPDLIENLIVFLSILGVPHGNTAQRIIFASF